MTGTPWMVAYAVLLLFSVAYYFWLTWRLNRGASGRLVFWRAAAWIGAPDRWFSRIAEGVRTRYRASALNTGINGFRSCWDRVPLRQKRLLSMALCLMLFIILIVFEILIVSEKR